MANGQFQKPYKGLISSPVYIKYPHSMVPNIWWHPQTMFSGGFSGEGILGPVATGKAHQWLFQPENQLGGSLPPDFDQGACINEGHQNRCKN
jgi:hypothetical protein